MLKEFPNLRQHDEGYRRLFYDGYFDLYIWYEREGGPLTGFQLVYDKRGYQRSLTWTEAEGFSHNRIDEGERTGEVKMTPILVPDGSFDPQGVRPLFIKAAESLEPGLCAFVLEKLDAYQARPRRKAL
jgi:hypothetical protein